MVLSKQLVLSACEPEAEVIKLVDQKVGNEIDFILFGDLIYENRAYIFGANFSKYIRQFNADAEEITIQLYEIIEDESTKHALFSSDFTLSKDDTEAILKIIKYMLSSIVVNKKYSPNHC